MPNSEKTEKIRLKSLQEPALFDSKDLNQGYDQAWIRLAILKDKDTSKLLFGVVELIPASPFKSKKEKDLPRGGKCPNPSRVNNLEYWIINATPEQGQSFYYDPQQWIEQNFSKFNQPENLKKALSNLLIEPVTPYFDLEMCLPNMRTETPYNQRNAPFVKGKFCRFHRKISREIQDISLNQKMIERVEDLFAINLENYKEYIGALALVVPSLDIEEIKCQMLPSSEEDPLEKLHFCILKRPNGSLGGYRLTIIQENQGSIVQYGTYDVPPNGILTVDAIGQIDLVGWYLESEKSGAVGGSELSGFLRNIVFSMSVVQSKVRSQVPVDNKNNALILEKEKFLSKGTTSHEIREFIPRFPSIQMARFQRDKLQKAEEVKQYLFLPNQQKKALEFLDSIISQVVHKLIIADPYFGERDFLRLITSVTQNGIETIILTSKDAFKSQIELKNFNTRLEEFRKIYGGYTPQKGISVYVMKGDNYPLHDRFLILDDVVWEIGASFNHLGAKLSQAMKMPNPTPIIDQIEKFIKARDTQSFEKFFQDKLDDK